MAGINHLEAGSVFAHIAHRSARYDSCRCVQGPAAAGTKARQPLKKRNLDWILDFEFIADPEFPDGCCGCDSQ